MASNDKTLDFSDEDFADDDESIIEPLDSGSEDDLDGLGAVAEEDENREDEDGLGGEGSSEFGEPEPEEEELIAASEDTGEAEGDGAEEGHPSFLKEKLLGLPVWLWMLLLVGGLAGGFAAKTYLFKPRSYGAQAQFGAHPMPHPAPAPQQAVKPALHPKPAALQSHPAPAPKVSSMQPSGPTSAPSAQMNTHPMQSGLKIHPMGDSAPKSAPANAGNTTANIGDSQAPLTKAQLGFDPRLVKATGEEVLKISKRVDALAGTEGDIKQNIANLTSQMGQEQQRLSEIQSQMKAVSDKLDKVDKTARGALWLLHVQYHKHDKKKSHHRSEASHHSAGKVISPLTGWAMSGYGQGIASLRSPSGSTFVVHVGDHLGDAVVKSISAKGVMTTLGLIPEAK